MRWLIPKSIYDKVDGNDPPSASQAFPQPSSNTTMLFAPYEADICL